MVKCQNSTLLILYTYIFKKIKNKKEKVTMRHLFLKPESILSASGEHPSGPGTPWTLQD